MLRHIFLSILFFLPIGIFCQNIPIPDLIFDLNNNNDLHEKLKNENLTTEIRVVSFIGYDSIPSCYSLFENINTVILENSNIKGLDNFPSLESLYLIESGNTINEKEDWLKKIKHLYIHKVYLIEGFSSFKNTPLLEELVLSYSGFNNFPSDIESLERIETIILGAYTGTIIDLNLINIKDMPSLREFEITSWSNNIINIPRGIQSSHLSKLKINHPNLTPQEKSVLKRYQ